MSNTTGRGFRWLLLGSLGLNLALLLAMALSQAGWHGRHGGHGSRAFDLPSPRAIREVLEEPRREVLEEIYAAHRKPLVRAMRARHQARREVRALMLAAEFDPQRIDQAFAELRAKDEAASAAVQSMLMELLGQLTAEERERVGNLVPQRHGHRHRQGEEHRHEHGDRQGRDDGERGANSEGESAAASVAAEQSGGPAAESAPDEQAGDATPDQ